MKEFSVYVAVFNCNEFVNKYRKYIKKCRDAWFGDIVYTLVAPNAIFAEVANLKDESITIV